MTATTTRSASSAGSPLRTATSDQVRSKFLQKIGIDVPRSAQSDTSRPQSPTSAVSLDVASSPQSPKSSWVHPRNQRVQCFREGLKYDKSADLAYNLKRQRKEQRRLDQVQQLQLLDQSYCSRYQPRCGDLSESYSSSCSDTTLSTVATSFDDVPHSMLSKPKKRTMFNEEVSVVPIPMRSEYSHRIKSRLWANAQEIHENAARNALEFATEGYVVWRARDLSTFACDCSHLFVSQLGLEKCHGRRWHVC
jgi:hypothetical protein